MKTYSYLSAGLVALSLMTTPLVNAQTFNPTLSDVISGNTSGGTGALPKTAGKNNTAFGKLALSVNTGTGNVAVGGGALQANTTGFNNTVVGGGAGRFNETGQRNTFIGFEAGRYMKSGQFNTAIGSGAMMFNLGGESNTAVGFGALSDLSENILSTQNIAVGAGAGYLLRSGHQNIYIGYDGAAHESYSIHIGTQDEQFATYIAGITNQFVYGKPVCILSTGQLGNCTSSSANPWAAEIAALKAEVEALKAIVADLTK